jgi:F0F1-type ATP synthase delta subunit
MSKIPLHQVASVLVKRSEASGFNKSRFAQEIAAYLLESGRTGQLNSLAREMVSDRAKTGVVEATAVSAHELSAGVRTDIREEIKRVYPHAKEIIINERLETKIVGGVRLEFPDSQLDLSVRNKLNKFNALTA